MALLPTSRVILLTPGLAGKDGVSAVSREVLRALANETLLSSLTVWSLADDDRDASAASHITLRGASGSRPRFAQWGIRAAASNLEETTVLVLHAHLLPIALPMSYRGAQLAVFLHGVEAWHRQTGLRSLALRRASLILANSGHTRALFRQANPSYGNHDVRICHLGLPRQAPLAESPVPRAGFALMVGRMAAEERYKGHDLLLDLWPEVLRQVPHACLVIAGDGDDRPRLEQKAAALMADGRVIFTGRVSDEALARLYLDCGFFILPSAGEGFGLVFLEAMRAGKACIGGLGAAAEVIQHDATGLVVDPSRFAEVLAAIVRLYRHSDLCQRMGSAGAKSFAEQFTTEKFGERLRTLLGFPAPVPAAGHAPAVRA